MLHVPEEFRIKTGRLASDASFGNNGAFFIPSPISKRRTLFVIAGFGMDWEHVSVHAEVGYSKDIQNIQPYWAEMCYVKDLFWDGEDVVMQLHPKKSDYINLHPGTLHLWRPVFEKIPTPYKIMV